MQPRELTANEILQSIDHQLNLTVEKLSSWTKDEKLGNLASEYQVGLLSLSQDWKSITAEPPSVVLNMQGLYLHYANLKKLIDDFESKAYKIIRNDFSFINETCHTLVAVLDKYKEQIAVAKTSIFLDPTTLSQLNKNAAFEIIETLPPEQKIAYLEKSFNKTTLLGKFFWNPEGYTACGLSKGTLNKIIMSYFQLASTNLNLVAKKYMEEWADGGMRIPKGVSYQDFQKDHYFKLIKTTISDKDLEVETKITILLAAMSPLTDLGTIFWAPRGYKKPNLDSGTLNELQTLLHQQHEFQAQLAHAKSAATLFQPAEKTQRRAPLPTPTDKQPSVEKKSDPFQPK